MDEPNPPAARRRGRPPRPDAAAETTSNRLLDAAIKLFARYGYDGVSTGDISKATGVTQSMVHYHFGSKEQIWQAAVLRLMRQRGLTFAPARLKLRGLEPLAKLELLIRQLVEANSAHPDYARILMQESVVRTARLDWLIDQFIRSGFEVFDEVIKDAMDAGLIKRMPVHDVTNIVTSAASFSFSVGALVQQIYGIDPELEEHRHSLATSIVQIVFDGLRTKRP